MTYSRRPPARATALFSARRTLGSHETQGMARTHAKVATVQTYGDEGDRQFDEVRIDEADALASTTSRDAATPDVSATRRSRPAGSRSSPGGLVESGRRRELRVAVRYDCVPEAVGNVDQRKKDERRLTRAQRAHPPARPAA